MLLKSRPVKKSSSDHNKKSNLNLKRKSFAEPYHLAQVSVPSSARWLNRKGQPMSPSSSALAHSVP
jgi:hypothetical protein